MMYDYLNRTNVNGAQPTQLSAVATQDFSDRQGRFHNVSSGRIHVGDNVTSIWGYSVLLMVTA